MAFIAITGEPGCRHERLARTIADQLDCELITESTLKAMMGARIPTQGGETRDVDGRSWRPIASATLAGMAAAGRHLVVTAIGAETLVHDLTSMFRFRVVAPKSIRLANLMADHGLDRPAAIVLLQNQSYDESIIRKYRCGQKIPPVTSFDMVLNARSIPAAEMVEALVSTVRSRGLLEADPLPASVTANIQFQAARELAKHRPNPKVPAPPGEGSLARKIFGHPSEEMFANLLDLYSVAWDYEPRSFPLQWDKDGKVSEAFTPDFYLPEFDLYVELTTMKQANVTKKNRKIRLLRAIYPHVNIEIFYQKDVQNLVMNHRLPDRLAR